MRAAAEGFDGAVLLWVKEVQTERGSDVQVAGPYGFSWEERESSTDVRVSAAVVSVAADREVWSGVIERRGDKGKMKDARAIARAVARQIKSDHLVD